MIFDEQHRLKFVLAECKCFQLPVIYFRKHEVPVVLTVSVTVGIGVFGSKSGIGYGQSAASRPAPAFFFFIAACRLHTIHQFQMLIKNKSYRMSCWMAKG